LFGSFVVIQRGENAAADGWNIGRHTLCRREHTTSGETCAHTVRVSGYSGGVSTSRACRLADPAQRNVTLDGKAPKSFDATPLRVDPT